MSESSSFHHVGCENSLSSRLHLVAWYSGARRREDDLVVVAA